MNTRDILRLTLTAFIGASAFGCGSTEPAPTPAAEPPPELAQPKRKLDVRTEGSCTGKVTKLGPNWVEIGAGWVGYREVGGKLNEGNDKPKRISCVGTKAGGDVDAVGGLDTYLLTDLKVGDSVTVHTVLTVDKEEFCGELQILRRPGGKIPMGRFMLKPNNNSPTQFQNQAEQDWEEKGVPIPREHLPEDGRAPWTNPPYPPVAPLPREVKP